MKTVILLLDDGSQAWLYMTHVHAEGAEEAVEEAKGAARDAYSGGDVRDAVVVEGRHYDLTTRTSPANWGDTYDHEGES